jgi:hypothetical protein
MTMLLLIGLWLGFNALVVAGVRACVKAWREWKAGR